MNVYRNKVAMITGGASGIGKALCEELARRGATVIVADIREEAAHDTAKEIVASGGQARGVRLDVTDETAVRELVQAVADEYGHLDYMFNNAGIAMMGEVYEMELEDWRRIMDINLWGVIYGTDAAYKIMKQQGHGYIVNTASAAGLGPAPMTAAYGATKQAVIGLSTSLHYEAEAYGVNVSVVCPAFVKTPINDSMKMINFDRTKMEQQFAKQKYQSPEQCVRSILKQMDRRKAVIRTDPMLRVVSVVFKVLPFLEKALMRLVVRTARQNKRNPDISL